MESTTSDKHESVFINIEDLSSNLEFYKLCADRLRIEGERMYERVKFFSTLWGALLGACVLVVSQSEAPLHESIILYAVLLTAISSTGILISLVFVLVMLSTSRWQFFFTDSVGRVERAILKEHYRTHIKIPGHYKYFDIMPLFIMLGIVFVLFWVIATVFVVQTAFL